jgi:hypothetical protein
VLAPASPVWSLKSIIRPSPDYRQLDTARDRYVFSHEIIEITRLKKVFSENGGAITFR